MSEEAHRKAGRSRSLASRDSYAFLNSRILLVALVQALAVADHQNLRRAAETLGISQSVVSHRIKMLEENLGILLFERRHRGVRLTPAGRNFLEEVAQALEHLDYAVKSDGMIVHGEQGHLDIGLHSPIADGFLSDLLDLYREAHPNVEIEIVERRLGDPVRYVREERFDVAFILGAPVISDCHSKSLWSEPLVVALPADHRLAKAESVHWADLGAETFIVRNGGAGSQLYDRPIVDEPEPAIFSAVWSPFNRNQALRDLLALARRRSRQMNQGEPPRFCQSPCREVRCR